MPTKAVCFDVDFTLIEPGPRFRAEGYRAFCESHGIEVEESRFSAALASAASLLDGPEDTPYAAEIFVTYIRHIIEQMGGCGPTIDQCAREIYAEWAACHHFELYDDVRDVLADLASRGIRIGLISNTHRSLVAFRSHFELDGVISAAISSSDHGFMKPHPSIFAAALEQLDVAAADAVMVGDSVRQDVDGALRVGMRAVLLHRSPEPHPRARELAQRAVAIVRSLSEVPELVLGS